MNNNRTNILKTMLLGALFLNIVVSVKTRFGIFSKHVCPFLVIVVVSFGSSDLQSGLFAKTKMEKHMKQVRLPFGKRAY